MTDATSPCPPEASPEVLSDPAAVLFGLEHQFRVLHAERTAPDAIKVLVELTAREGPCTACGVLTTAVKERPLSRLKDLPAFGPEGGAVVAQASVGVPEDVVPAPLVHPGLRSGAAPRPGHRTAPRPGGGGDRVVEPGCVRRRRRVRRVVADRAPGPDRRCGPLVAYTDTDPGWGSMRPGSGRSAGSWTGSPGNGPTRG
jgi:hypothetical protein